jgi:hypothetical protein
MMVLVLPPAQAEVPRTMAFQGKLTDTNGQPLDGSRSVTFRIYTVASGGTKLWEEGKTLTVSGGLFSTLLGDTTPLALPFDQPYWVEIVVGTETLSPRQPLASSPYAMRAKGLDGLEVVNGNVGIGTASPGSRLTLKSPGPGGQEVLELRDSGDSAGDASAIVWKNASGVTRATIYQTGAGNSFRFIAAGDIMFGTGAVGFTASGERMVISTNGYVYANVQPYSDATQKTQLQPLTGALERVTALRGITYRWKDKTLDQEKQMGFSAQEVEKVFPELVRVAPNGLKTVAYDHLTAALVEAVKEQQREIEGLKREMESLKRAKR